MYPRGILYHSSSLKRHHTVNLHAPFFVRMIFAIFQTTGIFLVAGSMIYVFYSLAPLAREEVVYAVSSASVQKYSPPQILEPKHDFSEAEKTVLIQNEAKSLGLNSEFSLYVPKINAKASVIANVDPGNEKEYLKALQSGVAHAKGTFFPGQGKLTYLFSHSTNSPLSAARFSPVFYLLRKLEADDLIVVYFADKKYEYKVVSKIVVAPTDTSWLGSQDSETLILQTCTPLGTSLNRLLVIAKSV